MNKELAERGIYALEQEICAAIERLQELKGYTQEWTVVLKTETGFEKKQTMRWPLPREIYVLRKIPFASRVEQKFSEPSQGQSYKFARDSFDFIARTAIYEEI